MLELLKEFVGRLLPNDRKVGTSSSANNWFCELSDIQTSALKDLFWGEVWGVKVKTSQKLQILSPSLFIQRSQSNC